MFGKFKKAFESPPNDKSLYFKVAGVTYDNEDGTNRQDVLKELAKDVRDVISPEDIYCGMRNKDFSDFNGSMSELEAFKFEVDVVKTEFDGETAYQVSHGDYGVFGYMPKDKIDEYEDLKYHYDKKTYTAHLTGGKMKRFNFDTEKVEVDTLNYGMIVEVNGKGYLNR